MPLVNHETERPGLPDAEVSPVRGELTAGEWTFHDARHRGFVMESGRGKVTMSDGEVAFAAPCLVWLPAGARARLLLEAGSRGISLAVGEVGLASAISAGTIAGQMRAALGQPMIHARLEIGQARRLSDTLAAIGDEVSREAPGAQEARRHLLALFLIA